jgi:hypothetical protein
MDSSSSDPIVSYSYARSGYEELSAARFKITNSGNVGVVPAVTEAWFSTIMNYKALEDLFLDTWYRPCSRCIVVLDKSYPLCSFAIRMASGSAKYRR